MSAIALGYEGTTRQVTLENGQITVVEIRLVSTAGAIVGQITDGVSEAPLAGAAVSVGRWTAVTDANGRYRLEGVVSGSYTLQVSLEGYATHQVPVTVEPRGSHTLDVALLPLAGFLKVRVVDAATGLPIEGATVTYASVVETAAQASEPCADAALLVPLKRSPQYREIRSRVKDPRPSDNWQQDGLHFFVFTLRGGEDGAAAEGEGGTPSPVEPPVAVFVMQPGLPEPISAVVVRSRPDGQDAEVTPIGEAEPVSSQPS